ncbi:MAG: nucleotidyltransferase domain-containing protein [Terriglobia bacterium]|jgi:predicted nucleotidyltransferase
MRKNRLERIIDEMVLRIVERFDPERIILFGSAARGDAGPDSDVDLLVVMPVEGSRREKAVEIGVAVNDIPVPKDIVVTTPEDFEWRKEIVGTIERPAEREGRLVYARR